MVQQPHAERKHSKWNSSGASRWTICFGQPNKAENYPERPDTKYSLDGEQAHQILELCVEAFEARQTYEPSRFTNSPVIIQSAAIVMDRLTLLRDEYPDLIIEGERKVWFPQDVVPKEDVGGTLDIFARSPSAKRLWMIDFKHGEGVPVEVVGNKQLLSYFCARCLGLEFVSATLMVIQPRCRHFLGPVREWEVTYDHMVAFINEVDEALRIGSQPNAPLVAGPHCRWCPCEHDCAERDRYALAGMQQDFAHIKDLAIWQPPDPDTLPIDKLVFIYQHKAQIVSWLEMIERTLIVAAVHHGVELDGFKVVEAQARRAWIEDVQKIITEIGAMSGGRLTVDDIYPRQMATITDLTNRLVQFATAGVPHGWKEKAAEATRAQLGALTERKSSGNLTLAPNSDYRPSTSKLAKDFGPAAAALPPMQPIPQQVPAFGALAAPIVDPQTLIHKD